MAQKFLLHDIDPDEIALVARGANRRKIVWKAMTDREEPEALAEKYLPLLKLAGDHELTEEEARAVAEALPQSVKIASRRAQLADNDGRKVERTMSKSERMFEKIALRRDALVTDGVSKDEALRRAAWEQVEEYAGELVEKSGFALSRETAIEQVGDRHPELLALYSGDYELADPAAIEKEERETQPPRDPAVVFAEIERLARNLVEKSGYALSLPQALDRVLKARPDLLAEYRDARDLVRR